MAHLLLCALATATVTRHRVPVYLCTPVLPRNSRHPPATTLRSVKGNALLPD